MAGLRFLPLGIAVLPLAVLCLSVVTVTPPLQEPSSISVRQFEKDFFQEFQDFLRTRVESEKLRDLKTTILNQGLPISIQELPKATEVTSLCPIKLVSCTLMPPSLCAASHLSAMSHSLLRLPDVQCDSVVPNQGTDRDCPGPLQALINGR